MPHKLHNTLQTFKLSSGATARYYSLPVLQAAEQDPPDALVAAAAQGGWRLFHLAPERATLEDVFVQLTQQEGAGPAPQSAEAAA